ncbi:MAG: hypothetical protein MMC23_001962 [Stictis urceolatum]|nr:hypothetical protein [Stictis urceolata]
MSHETRRSYRSKSRPSEPSIDTDPPDRPDYDAFRLFRFGKKQSSPARNVKNKKVERDSGRRNNCGQDEDLDDPIARREAGRHARTLRDKKRASNKDVYRPFPASPASAASNDFFASNIPGNGEPFDESSNPEALRKRADMLERELQRLQYLLQNNNSSAQTSPPSPPQKSSSQMSLLEQLFPEEAAKEKVRLAAHHSSPDSAPTPPRLDPLDFPTAPETPPTSPSPSTDLYREQDLTIMILSGLSSLLSNSDFQRIIPRGQHIEEWRGPGDVLKVIPLRDPHTLAHKGAYVLVFVNPAYARAYKTHIERLHELARHHTPMQLSSSPRSTQGPHPVEEFFRHTSVQQAVADYALCPLGQELSARIVFPPYQHRLRRLLAAKGYEQITQPVDRTGRAVVVWVEGHVPTAGAVERWLRFDGWQRGVGWSVLSERGRFRKLEVQAGLEDAEEEEEWEERGGVRLEGVGFERAEGTREVERRWLLTFEDEPEARRFVRAWHKRPWPGEQLRDVSDEREMPIVNVEFLW